MIVHVVTHANESHGSKAFIRICVCVCLIESKQLKLQYNHQTCYRDSPSWFLATHLTSKGQGLSVQKHIWVEGDQMAGTSLHSVEWHHPV